MATTTTTEIAPAPAAPVTGKRKRNNVSYAVDEYFDDLELEEDVSAEAEDEDDGVQSEDDDTFGSAKVSDDQLLHCNIHY